MGYEVRIDKKAEARLTRMLHSGQKDVVSRIVEGLNRLSEDPFRSRSGADILQLESVYPKLYRLRVGKYRVLYSIDRKKKVVNITMILHRKKAYR